MTKRKNPEVDGRKLWGVRGKGWRLSYGYRELRMPWHPNAHRNGYVREHVWVMSRMIGKPVPQRFVVHHMDGDKLNNSPSNLMLCTKQEHHRYHLQMDALVATGDADKRSCRFCSEFDDPRNMVKHGTGFCHYTCRAESWQSRKARYQSTTNTSGGKSMRLRAGLESGRGATSSGWTRRVRARVANA